MEFSELSGVELRGVAWSGVEFSELSGVEWRGVEWSLLSGVEWSDGKRTRLKSSNSDRCRMRALA